jgi:hypothetical protein
MSLRRLFAVLHPPPRALLVALSFVGTLAFPAFAVGSPELVSSIRASSASALVGGSLTFSGSVSNTGDTAASNAVVQFNWTTPSTLGRAPAIGGPDGSGCGRPTVADDGTGEYHVDCTYATIGPGASIQVNLGFSRIPRAGSGFFSLSAGSDVTEGDLENNYANIGYIIRQPPFRGVSTRRFLFGGPATVLAAAPVDLNLDRNHDGKLDIQHESTYLYRGRGQRIRFYYRNLLRSIDRAPGGRRDGFVTLAEMNRWVATRFDRNHNGLLDTREIRLLYLYSANYIQSA